MLIFASRACASAKMRTIEVAMLANAFGLGSVTLGAGGQWIMIASGVSVARASVTTILSAGVTWPAARVMRFGCCHGDSSGHRGPGERR